MKKYINQLLADIESNNRITDLSFHNVMSTSELNEVDEYLEYISDESRLPFSHYCKIEGGVFPPADMLERLHITELCDALHTLFLSWNIAPDLPEQLPINQTYQFLTSILDMKITPTENAMIGIEFCDYVIEDCPFGQDHCNCKVWQEEIRENLEIQIQEVLECINEFIDNQGHEEYLYINYNGAEQFKRYKMPLKPIGDCIGLDIYNIPSAYELNLGQIDCIINTFLKAWHHDDAVHLLFIDKDPIKRYEIWQEFIHSLAWFDGLSEFILCPDNLKEVLEDNGDDRMMLLDDDDTIDSF